MKRLIIALALCLLASSASGQELSTLLDDTLIRSGDPGSRKYNVYKLRRILDKDLGTPPGSPTVHDRYIVPAGATGAWAGLTDNIVRWNGTSWVSESPVTGALVRVVDEALTYEYSGSAWAPLPIGAIRTTTGPTALTVGAIADGEALVRSGSTIVGTIAGDALTANPLSQFAATTSAQLRGVLSDETGTGADVFAGSPTFTGSPVLADPIATTLTLGGGASGLFGTFKTVATGPVDLLLAQSVTEFDPGEFDPVWTVGPNCTQVGGAITRLNASYGALCETYEGHYKIGGLPAQEWHIQHVESDATLRRLLSINARADTGESSFGVTVDHLTLQTTDTGGIFFFDDATAFSGRTLWKTGEGAPANARYSGVQNRNDSQTLTIGSNSAMLNGGTAFAVGPDTGNASVSVELDSRNADRGFNFWLGYPNTTPENSFTIGVLGAQIVPLTATPAGGTAGLGLTFGSTANFGTFFGSGAPTLSAAQGSLYLRSNGAAGYTRGYLNTNGATGWTGIVTDDAFSTYGKTLVDDADAATARATLGLDDSATISVSSPVEQLDCATITTTETVFGSSVIIPTSTLIANVSYRVTMMLLVTGSNGPTLNISLRQTNASGPLLFSQGFLQPGSVTGAPASFYIDIVGTAAAGASVNTYTTEMGNSNLHISNTSGFAAQPVALATNAAIELFPTLDCSAGTAGNSVTLVGLRLERLAP